MLREEVLDPLAHLWTPGDHAHAQVGMSVGTQYDFGRIKVTAHVQYECDQKMPMVEEAGLLSFTKAVEFMNEGMTLLITEGQATGVTP